MSRPQQDRAPLLAWLAKHPTGVTTKQVQAFAGWRSADHACDVMQTLRAAGLVASYGKIKLARWCSPEHMPTLMLWHTEQKAWFADTNRRRHWKNPEAMANMPLADWSPHQVVVQQWEKPQTIPPRSVFELAGTA